MSLEVCHVEKLSMDTGSHSECRAYLFKLP